MSVDNPAQLLWPLRWTLRDMAVLAVNSVVLGGVFFLWEWVVQMPSRILEGSPSSLIFSGLLNGVWYWGGLVLAYAIRKQGSALLGEVGASLVAYMLPGSPGVNILVLGWVHGIALELAFAWAGFNQWGLLVMLVAGALAGLASFAVNVVALPLLVQQTGGTVISVFIAVLLSGVILGGLVCKILGDRILAIPAVRNFLGTQAI